MSQRWRLTIARGPAGRDVLHREVSAAWSAILERLQVAAASPTARSRDGSEGAPPVDDREGGRGRVTFAAPAPAGMTSRAELVDVVLPSGRLTRHRLIELVQPLLPTGHTVVDAHDVWTGEPSLPSLVAAADYVVDVLPTDPPAQPDAPGAIVRSVAALLAATVIPRPGRDAARANANLRPLIVDLRRGEDARLWMRLRVDQELGSGRPEEVVDALGRLGPALTVIGVERVGFVLRPPPVRAPRVVAGPARTPPRRTERPPPRSRSSRPDGG